MLELYQLLQLLAIAECGTISKAAEQLHLSQPALSRSMQKLEEELQVTLFDRQKNKITLNKNGRLAVEQARRVVEQGSACIADSWMCLVFPGALRALSIKNGAGGIDF